MNFRKAMTKIDSMNPLQLRTTAAILLFAVMALMKQPVSAFSPGSQRRSFIEFSVFSSQVLQSTLKHEFEHHSIPSTKPKKRQGPPVASLRADDDHNGLLVTFQNDSIVRPSRQNTELLLLTVWMASLSAFVLTNHFVGPWPEGLQHVHERVLFMGHMVGAMLFGGGIFMTTVIEYLVSQTKHSSILKFWFEKVSFLDMALVLPGLTLSMISGIGLTTVRYGDLSHAPPHIVYALWSLAIFGLWWAFTDLTTQESALKAVMGAETCEENLEQEIPKEVSSRIVSNVGSCLLVLVVYGIMVLKPGTIHYS